MQKCTLVVTSDKIPTPKIAYKNLEASLQLLSTGHSLQMLDLEIRNWWHDVDIQEHAYLMMCDLCVPGTGLRKVLSKIRGVGKVRLKVEYWPLLENSPQHYCTDDHDIETILRAVGAGPEIPEMAKGFRDLKAVMEGKDDREWVSYPRLIPVGTQG